MTTDDPVREGDGSDPLDELLRQARWPEPGRERLERLHRHWNIVSSSTRRAHGLMLLSAVAAVLLLCFGLSWLFWPAAELPALRPRDQQDSLTDSIPRHESRGPLDDPPTSPRPPDVAATAETDRSIQAVMAPIGPRQVELVDTRNSAGETGGAAASRPASAYETVAFLAVERRKRAPLDRERSDQLQAAIQALVEDPAADAARVCEPLLAARNWHERHLLQWLPRLNERLRPAVIALCTHIGSSRCVPALRDLAGIPELHESATRALCRLADAETLAGLIADETDAGLRRAIYAALVGRSDANAISLFLKHVDHPATREEALSAAAQVKSIPVDLLFEFLDSRRQTQRLAAALVLGRIDDPAIERRLIRIVQRDVGRQEALLALLESPGAEAARFLQAARRDLMLVSAVQAAEFQRRVMSN